MPLPSFGPKFKELCTTSILLTQIAPSRNIQPGSRDPLNGIYDFSMISRVLITMWSVVQMYSSKTLEPGREIKAT